LLHPAMFIGAPDEEYARQVHARVEQIVAELPLAEWESAKRELFEEIWASEFPEADANTHAAQMTPLTAEERSRLFSRLTQDAESRLGNEGKQDSLVVMAAGIIRAALDDDVIEFIDPEDKQASEEEKGLFAFEQMTFALHCIGRFAFTNATAKKRQAFMDDVVFCVGALLWQIAAFDVAEDRFAPFFATEYNRRADEYDAYPWNPEEKDCPSDVGWEHGKKLLKIVTPEQDAIKVAALGNVALRSAERLIPLVQEVIEKYQPD